MKNSLGNTHMAGDVTQSVRLYHTSMFLTNQIAQLRVLDFTYTTISCRRNPPQTLTVI